MPMMLVALAIASSSCQRPPPSEMRDARASVNGPGEGTKLTVEGVAGNAKAGAVVETDDRVVVYIRGLGAWPAATNGKRVRATGTLRIEHHDDPCPRPGEQCAAGVAGDQRWLEDAALTDAAGNPVVER